MSAELTLRCVLAGILAVVLLHVGLVADRLLPPLAALDPDAAPAAFYAANLLLYAASLVVSFPVLRDGLNGLRGRPLGRDDARTGRPGGGGLRQAPPPCPLSLPPRACPSSPALQPWGCSWHCWAAG